MGFFVFSPYPIAGNTQSNLFVIFLVCCGFLTTEAKTKTMNPNLIHQKIYEVRSEKVMPDFDLAALYSVLTKVLNQAVKRNIDRFPADFMFQLSQKKWKLIKSQMVTPINPKENRLQIVTGSLKNRYVQFLSFAFTEHGVTMLASILRSKKAIKMNIAIVRAFIALSQVAMQYKELAEKLASLESSDHKKFTEIYQP